MSEFEADLAATLELHRSGRLDEAERRYADLLTANPHRPFLHNLLGLIAYQRHQLKPAAGFIRRALCLGPDETEAWHNLSLVERADRGDGDLRASRRAAAIEPNDARRWLHLVDQSPADGRSGRRAVALDPVAHRAWRRLAEHSLDGEDAARALTGFRRSSAIVDGSIHLAVFNLIPPPVSETCPIAPAHLAMSDGVVNIAPYCTRLRDATVTGDFLVLTERREALIDGLVPDPADPLQLTRSVVAIGPRHAVMRLGRIRRIGRAMLLGGSPNYYHWLIDHLPRLALHAPEPDRSLIVNADLTALQRTTLERLGFAPARLVGVSPDDWVQAEDLVLPSLMARSSLVHPAVIAWLRRLFLQPDAGDASPKRIYVSRRRAERRRLLDEQRLVEALQKRDFAVLEPETMSVERQARLFAGAEVIVASHGAALTNLVFASTGCRVIEIDAEGSHRTFYAAIAAIVDLSYERLAGRAVNPLELQDSDIILGDDGLRALERRL